MALQAYCTIALTPAADLTLDCQVLNATFEGVDNAVVLGMRFNTTF